MSSNKFKIKRVGQSLHIITADASSIMPLVTESDTNRAIDTLVEALYSASHQNAELKKSVSDDVLVESFSTDSIEPLYEAVTLNIGSSICRDLKKALACAPSHLQGEILRAVANVTSRIYKDASEMVSIADDQKLLSKSLFQKGVVIDKDLALLTDKLDEPLNQVKQMKMEREIRKSVLSTAIDQAKMVERRKMTGVTDEVLDVAKGIVKANQVINDKESAIAAAKKLARSL